jgi:hypothetical protein
MRHPRLTSIMIVATAFAVVGVLAPVSVLAQQPPAQPNAPAQSPAPAQSQAPAPPQAPAPVKAGPYNVVAIKLPAPVSDASFETFRKQLADIAKKKDRAALARLVASSFFWIPEDADVADKAKPAIDNLAKAIDLDGKDAFGWDVITEYAGDNTGNPDPQRPGVICSPGEPGFDEKAADELANATQTDASDWVYPVRDGVEVRSDAQPTASVVEKLGLYLVRAIDDDSPANAVTQAFVKVMTPSGKSGYVPVDAVKAVVGPQMCYLKDASGWKIAGFLGGDPSHAN